MMSLSMKQLGMRLGEMVLVLIGISFITFCLIMLAPGDPVRQMIAGNEDIIVSQVEIDALRHELGLDKPFLLQYLDWLGRVVQGNFGFSFMMKKPVIDAVMEALPASVILALASSVFMLVFSIPLGIYTAVKQNTWFDYLVRGCTFAGVSVPNFWMGLMLLWVFALKLSLFPIVGGSISLENLILRCAPWASSWHRNTPVRSVPRCWKNCIRTTSWAHVPAASRKATSSGVKSCRMPSSRWSPSSVWPSALFWAVPLS